MLCEAWSVTCSPSLLRYWHVGIVCLLVHTWKWRHRGVSLLSLHGRKITRLVSLELGSRVDIREEGFPPRRRKRRWLNLNHKFAREIAVLLIWCRRGNPVGRGHTCFSSVSRGVRWCLYSSLMMVTFAASFKRQDKIACYSFSYCLYSIHTVGTGFLCQFSHLWNRNNSSSYLLRSIKLAIHVNVKPNACQN